MCSEYHQQSNIANSVLLYIWFWEVSTQTSAVKVLPPLLNNTAAYHNTQAYRSERVTLLLYFHFRILASIIQQFIIYVAGMCID